MTFFTSSMISQQIAGQMGMFSAQAGYAQQLAYPGQAALYPGMPPPPPPAVPQFNLMSAAQRGAGGMYGEQLAMRAANFGQGAMTVGGAGMAIAGGLAGVPLDPFSAALTAGRMGFGMVGGGMGGLAMGGLAAAGAALPFYAVGKAVDTYGQAFVGGMQDQASLNSTLRNNFGFMGGQGPMGRGFSQGQMGQIGSLISGELRRNPFTSVGEMNSLIGGGAEAGMFTAVRDVQQFTQSFKKMLETLKSVQRELGGSLTEALQFVRGAQQAGIYQGATQANFAAEVRTAEAVTGMDRQQLIALSAQGAQISRAYGGVGRQGAFGALRVAQQLGAAVQSGAIDQTMLTEATGGLQGQEALQAFSMNLLNRAGSFSRRPMGRFSTFALSNSSGTGLDQDMMSRFLTGDISVSDVRGRAHQNVRSMGRARALNREGQLRGQIMEEGGLAGQIGMMRLMVGDRVLDQGDDLASLVLQRRFGMQRPEAEMMMGLMRNQGRIAEEEQFSRSGARREQAMRQDIAENRSLDAFMRHMEHGLSDATGVTKGREIGRNFLTRISSLAERAMNDVLGIAESSLNQQDRSAIGRAVMGRASADDLARISLGRMGTSGLGGGDPFRQGILQTGRSVGGTFAARGIDVTGMSAAQRSQAAADAINARSGLVHGRDQEQLRAMMVNETASARRMLLAQATAAASGNEDSYYSLLGGGISANAADAFAFARGMTNPGAQVSEGAMMGSGQSRITWDMVQRDAGRLLGGKTGAAMALLGPLGAVPAALASLGGLTTNLESVAALRATDHGLSYITRGGHQADRLTVRGAGGGVRGYKAGYSAVTGNGRSFNEADMGGFLDSDMFSSAARRMAGMAGDKDRLGAEISVLQRQVEGMAAGGQRNAAISVLEQLRGNVKEYGAIGDEFESRAISRERREEIMAELTRTSGGLRSISRGLSGDLAKAFEEHAATLLTGSGEDIQRGGAGLINRLADLQRENPTEYSRQAAVLGKTEQGRAMLMAAANQSRFERDVTGGGRRGRRGARESVLGAISGNMLSSMEFSVTRGSGDNARQMTVRNQQQLYEMMFGKGGSAGDRAAIQGQFVEQLGHQVGAENAQAVFSEVQRMAEGGFTRDEARRLQQLTREKGIDAAGAAASRATMEARDPMGKERNDLLREIRDAVKKSAYGGENPSSNMSEPS